MKIYLVLLVAFIATLTAASFAQEEITLTNVVVVGFSSTNAPPVPAQAPETLQPILDLLGGKGTWITTLIAWFAAISVILAPFAVWIRNKLADAANKAAASSEDDDDTYLRSLFGNAFYRLLAFVLNFANIRLPTLAELERAIALQKEAAKQPQYTVTNPASQPTQL